MDDSPCPPGHNTPLPLRRSPPVSFKRLLGARPTSVWWVSEWRRPFQRPDERLRTGAVWKCPQDRECVCPTMQPVEAKPARAFGPCRTRDHPIEFLQKRLPLVYFWVRIRGNIGRRWLIWARCVRPTLSRRSLKAGKEGLMTSPARYRAQPAKEIGRRGPTAGREPGETREIDANAAELALDVKCEVAWLLLCGVWSTSWAPNGSRLSCGRPARRRK